MDALVVERAGDPLAALSTAFPTSVTVTRTSSEDCQTRQLIVWLDGREVATLMWGDSVRLDIHPGRHLLRVSNTLFWKTVPFTVRPGEQAFFEAINRNGFSTYLFALVLGVGPLFLEIRRM